jgi:hypothetical protein
VIDSEGKFDAAKVALGEATAGYVLQYKYYFC